MRSDLEAHKFDKEKWSTELSPILNLWKKLNQVHLFVPTHFRFSVFSGCVTLVNATFNLCRNEIATQIFSKQLHTVQQTKFLSSLPKLLLKYNRGLLLATIAVTETLREMSLAGYDTLCNVVRATCVAVLSQRC